MTSGQSNLTQGRIDAADRRFIIFLDSDLADSDWTDLLHH